MIFDIIILQPQDCFFVSVVIRNKPELHDKPVAVCHSDNPKGTAEISSANYPARNYGAFILSKVCLGTSNLVIQSTFEHDIAMVCVFQG